MPVIVTSAEPPRWHAVSAAVFAAMAVWLSTGAIAFRDPSGPRVGVLPVGVLPFIAAIVAAIIVFAAGARNPRGAAVAVSPLALLVIPWLPVPLPSAFLIWTGALTMPIWIGVAVAVVSVPLSEGAWHGYSRAPPRVQARQAFLAGCVICGLAAWSASAAMPRGDEPHYLVITQSLLHDHDLNVENNYAQGDYREYYGGPLNPDSRIRGRHGELYSVHAPGVPALVLPAFAVGGYRGVVVFLVLLSAAACALAWWVAWRATSSLSAAWFGWAVVVFSAPFLLESFTVYPDAPGGAVVLTAFWALWRIDAGERVSAKAWIFHGAALAALPWMHVRFALLAAVLGFLIVLRLLRTRSAGHVAAFIAVPILSAVGWLAASVVMYGTPNPAAAYAGQTETALTFLPDGLGGLLFDQGFGLLATAPALAIAFAGLPRMRRYAVEWGVTAGLYTAAVGSYAMWWAGASGPARFLVPLLLPLAVPAAVAWNAAASRGTRVVMTIALLVTAWMAGVQAGGGGGLLGYHARNVFGMTPAPWLGWANALVDLSQALPAFVPLPQGTPLGARMTAVRDGFAATVPWVLCFAAAIYVTVWTGRKRGAPLYEVVSASVAGFAIATMVAASAVWWEHGHRVEPLDAQLNVVRQLAGGRVLALDLLNVRRVPGVEALKMRLDVPVDDGSGVPSRQVSIPLLPAGSYLISTRGTLQAPAGVFAGADEEPFPLVTAAPADLVRGVTLDLPVAARALMLRDPSLAGVSAIEIRPIAARSTAGSKASAYMGVAHHAAAYGATRVFFLDDRTAPEENGFWIWGAREGEVIVCPTTADFTVVVRNGPVRNDVTVRQDATEERVILQPGEEHPIRVPATASGRARDVRIRTSAGFRPSDVDSGSRDQRYLGVYVVMPDHAGR